MMQLLSGVCFFLYLYKEVVIVLLVVIFFKVSIDVRRVARFGLDGVRFSILNKTAYTCIGIYICVTPLLPCK